MADLGETFNGDEVDTSGCTSGLIPNGKYAAHIIEATSKATASGGKMLQTTWEITEGDFERRQIWRVNFNYRNNNPETEERARKDLSKMTKAIGIGAFSDTDDLLQRVCMIDVYSRANSDPERPHENAIRLYGYSPYTAQDPAPRATTQRPATQQRPADASTGRSTHNGGSAATQRPAPAVAGRPWSRPGAAAST